MKATDLSLLTSVSRPTIHPDGSRAVISVTRPDLDADSTVGQLWSVPLDSGEGRRITRGRHDTRPRFSPDGELLAFVRSVDNVPQLHLIDAGGGEPMAVTDAALGVADYSWAPDSRRIAFTARVAEAGRYGSVTGLGAGAEPPRRITNLRYRANGVGHTNDRPSQVFILTVPDLTAEPLYPTAPSADFPTPGKTSAIPVSHQLTTGGFDHSLPTFTPDGAHLAFVAARHATRDDDLVTQVFRLELDADQPEPLPLTGTHRRYGISGLAFAEDGALFFLAIDLGETARDFVGRATSLYIIDGADGAPRRLTDETIDLGESDAEITLVGDAALVQNRARGRVELLRVRRGGEISTIADGDLQIDGVDAVSTTVVISASTPTSAGELAVIESGTMRVLTEFSAPLRDTVIPPTELEVIGRDGSSVHGWVLRPTGEGPHPVLLNIHGGPFAQYGVAFFDEAQVYAAAGYAVVMCNPRGAAGYGEAHARAIRQRMGTVDLEDVIDFLDGVLEQHPEFDSERVGIMGGSYGGYLTAWAIAHDHRFAAAIVERGFLDPDGFVGTSDIGSFFGDEYAGTDPDLTRSQSPQAVVGRVATATLVIHSADDLRCPLPQGERYYAALKRSGVETELLVFPGENHEMSRAGRPRHRLQRFEAILDWWARYLPTATNRPGGIR